MGDINGVESMGDINGVISMDDIIGRHQWELLGSSWGSWEA